MTFSDMTSALTLDDQRSRTIPYDVNNTPNGLVRIGASVTLGLLLLAVVVTVASIPLGLQINIWLPDVPASVAPVLACVGMVLFAVAKFTGYAERAKDTATKGYANLLLIEKMNAEARLLEAQARLAAATPPVIAETIRTIPVTHAPTARLAPDDRPPEAGAPVAGLGAPRPQFWNGTAIRADDFREFIKRSLPPRKHSRRSWLMRELPDRTLPSGKVINDQADYDLYMNELVKFKVILNRGGEGNATGDWLTTDYAEICRTLGL